MGEPHTIPSCTLVSEVRLRNIAQLCRFDDSAIYSVRPAGGAVTSPIWRDITTQAQPQKIAFRMNRISVLVGPGILDFYWLLALGAG